MGFMHRATINIDDETWERLRLVAFEKRQPISRVVNAILNGVLAPPLSPKIDRVLDKDKPK